MTVSIPVSVGELVDKITILEIKRQMIKDKDKLQYVNEEHEQLTVLLAEYEAKHRVDIPTLLMDKMYAVNLTMWHLEDKVRIKEREQDFGPEFVELARSVYVTNDLRFNVKSQISECGKSDILEQKSYEEYHA